MAEDIFRSLATRSKVYLQIGKLLRSSNLTFIFPILIAFIVVRAICDLVLILCFWLKIRTLGWTNDFSTFSKMWSLSRILLIDLIQIHGRQNVMKVKHHFITWKCFITTSFERILLKLYPPVGTKQHSGGTKAELWWDMPELLDQW